MSSGSILVEGWIHHFISIMFFTHFTTASPSSPEKSTPPLYRLARSGQSTISMGKKKPVIFDPVISSDASLSLTCGRQMAACFNTSADRLQGQQGQKHTNHTREGNSPRPQRSQWETIPARITSWSCASAYRIKLQFTSMSVQSPKYKSCWQIIGKSKYWVLSFGGLGRCFIFKSLELYWRDEVHVMFWWRWSCIRTFTVFLNFWPFGYKMSLLLDISVKCNHFILSYGQKHVWWGHSVLESLFIIDWMMNRLFKCIDPPSCSCKTQTMESQLPLFGLSSSPSFLPALLSPHK